MSSHSQSKVVVAIFGIVVVASRYKSHGDVRIEGIGARVDKVNFGFLL